VPVNIFEGLLGIGGVFPYGDEEGDSKMIIAGINYVNNGCWKKR
jgi:hypothetical protein